MGRRALLSWSVAIALATGGMVWNGAVPAAAHTAAVSINFDDHAAPCLFEDTKPLRGQLIDQGANFKGPSTNGGGAVLNECGNFGVSGYSPPNFLAFNYASQLKSGGIPRGPETIVFPLATYTHVQINVAATSGGRALLQAFDVNDQLVASSTISLSSTLATISVDDPNGRATIKAVRLNTHQSVWVADDLSAS